MTPTFQGEVLMRRWSDSSTQGVQVTFALPDASDLEPLKIKTGKRFMAVLVEIGDDEQPAITSESASEVKEKQLKGGEWAKLAGMWCNDPDFWIFLRGIDRRCAGIDSEPAASNFVRGVCGITSRAELDHVDSALQRFNAEIRYPFMKWMQARGIVK